MKTQKKTQQPSLTPAQKRVLELVADGLTDLQISSALNLSQHTIHTHMNVIMSHFRIHTRAGAVAIALREGLL